MREYNYKIILKGAPIGVMKTTAKKHGELIEFEGTTYFVQYTKGKAIFVGEDKGVKKKMEHYIGTKKISALPMNLGDYNNYRGWKIPENENPEREGYLVQYADGYESWSPKEVFEESYRDYKSLTFGDAIYLLKEGHRLSRKGWNGKDQWIFLISGNTLSYHTMADLVELSKLVDGVKHTDVIAMKTASNAMQVGWLASQTDMLAEDWYVVRKEV